MTVVAAPQALARLESLICAFAFLTLITAHVATLLAPVQQTPATVIASVTWTTRHGSFLLSGIFIFFP
jgi:hypothetical protein